MQLVGRVQAGRQALCGLDREVLRGRAARRTKNVYGQRVRAAGDDDGLSTADLPKVVDFICSTDMMQFEVETEDVSISLTRRTGPVGVHRSAAHVGFALMPADSNAFAPPQSAPAETMPDDAEVAGVPDRVEVCDDKGCVITEVVSSPKVGLFRAGKFFRGKQIGKDPCVRVGDSVKQGQVICNIEQLGNHWQVEAPMDGKVVKFLVEEGQAVGYKDPIAEVQSS
ncbi:unnamed protein product [Pedinophyceae sp. YPF-701]|nr:unnamed protein product [Pedinophyceae sp. YPF-701]